MRKRGEVVVHDRGRRLMGSPKFRRGQKRRLMRDGFGTNSNVVMFTTLVSKEIMFTAYADLLYHIT